MAPSDCRFPPEAFVSATVSYEKHSRNLSRCGNDSGLRRHGGGRECRSGSVMSRVVLGIVPLVPMFALRLIASRRGVRGIRKNYSVVGQSRSIREATALNSSTAAPTFVVSNG